MTCFAGLDVSEKTTAVCVLDADGRILREGMLASEPEAIAAYLRDAGADYGRVGLEAGPLSRWLYDALRGYGLPVVCLETRQLKAALAGARNKTDRNDARGIARAVRVGWFRAVHVKSEAAHERRALLGLRRLLQQQRLALEGAVRGTLKVFGLRLGPVTTRGFAERVRGLATERPALLATLETALTAREALAAQQARLDRQVLETARGDEVCRRLMTIPGVGAVVALTYQAAIDDPARFRRSRDVGAHLGLTPRRHQSGDTDRALGISKMGDAAARAALFEAAHVLLSRVRQASALRSWGLELLRRIGARRAKVAVARKLGIVMHRIWRDGSAFRSVSPDARGVMAG